MTSEVYYPTHFWQIHKRIYQKEWNTLDREVRRQILNDREGEMAKEFYANVHKLSVEFFEDGSQAYNSRHRFQYSP